MEYAGNLYDIIMPTPNDSRNYGVYKVFQTIVLEHIAGNTFNTCEITIEAGSVPGARIHFETYENTKRDENLWFDFGSVDAAVIEAGRLSHNKMRNGYKYRPPPDRTDQFANAKTRQLRKPL
ncbi:hypothetical protein [Hoeflea sp.]|uniref:hypothetical protein n=1 Tax=Hoeflea sp. TaxID=1940281 RepID=UPI003747DF81